MPGALSSPDPLHEALRAIVAPDRVLTRPIDLVRFASDASVYRLMPRAVVLSRGPEEIRALFAASRAARVPLTFRAAGTSLSGQAITDGILVESARYWRSIAVEHDGARVRLGPGAIGGDVNRALRRYGRKIGPDPASLNSCTVGGIVANNSSGMCCGVERNAYHTLASLTFILPSGTTIDTAAPDADARFRALEPVLADGLLALKARLEADRSLSGRIRAKYRLKNTTGYSLNAFLDFERPVDIFAHLLVGSEGTLGFVAEAVLATIADLPVRYTGLLLYPSIHAACDAIVPWRRAGAAALEVMDRAALRSVERQAGVPPALATLPDGAAGLLVELQSADEAMRPELERVARGTVGSMTFVTPPLFTHEAAEQAALWRVRAGLFPSVGAVRRRGTTVIIEDVVFPEGTLADGAMDLTRAFARYGYANAIIFGHAKDGNLHFVITPGFNDQAEIDHYGRFLEEVAAMVVERYDGSLKGEHGTGRNMAPFVEAEWGPEAVAIMRELKRLADPDGLLNPDVILNPSPRAHVEHLKPLPGIDVEVDTCIECGYCEPQCPSRDFTTTPRQRIVIRREMERRRQSGDLEGVADLEADFAFMAIDTCAVDGLCATTCPVGIDTGALTKRLRAEAHSAPAQRWGRRVAERFWEIEPLVRTGLRAGHLLARLGGDGTVIGLTRLLRRVFGEQHVPLWSPPMPRAARAELPASRREGAAAVYFPSCLSRMMGALPEENASLSLPDALVTIAARAGRPLHVPDVRGVCCGVPFSSKGFTEGHAAAVNHAIERMWAWSDDGRLPVVVDTSPCTYGLKTCRPALTGENRDRFDRLTILDAIEFVHDEVLGRLTLHPVERRVALHPVCSVTKMFLGPRFEAVIKAVAREVVTPPSAGCCGMAGDRGWLVPGLAASATAAEAVEVREAGAELGVASSRTCEANLARATGLVYRSFVFLVEEASR